MAPSKNPYHMATAWMEPSWLIEHMVMGRRSAKKASISSGVILMRARCFTPCPIASPLVATPRLLVRPRRRRRCPLGPTTGIHGPPTRVHLRVTSVSQEFRIPFISPPYRSHCHGTDDLCASGPRTRRAPARERPRTEDRGAPAGPRPAGPGVPHDRQGAPASARTGDGGGTSPPPSVAACPISLAPSRR